MYKTLGIQGVLNGVIISVLVILPALYLSHITNFHLFEEIEYAAMFFVTCISVYLGISRTKGRNIISASSYFDGMVKGLLILLFSGVTYATIWTSYNGATGHNLEQEYFQMMIQDMKAEGESEDDINDAINLAEYLMEHPVRKFLITIAEPTMYGILAPFLIPIFIRRKN